MGRAEVALTAVGKGLRERISTTNRIYCSLKERCKERMREGRQEGKRGGWRGGSWWLRLSGQQRGRCKLLAAGVQMEIVRLGQPTKAVRKKEEQKENPIVQMSKFGQPNFLSPPFRACPRNANIVFSLTHITNKLAEIYSGLRGDLGPSGRL